MGANVLVVALAFLVVIADYAMFIDHVGESVFVSMLTGRHRRGQLPQDEVAKGLGLRATLRRRSSRALVLVILPTVLACCQICQQQCQGLAPGGRYLPTAMNHMRMAMSPSMTMSLDWTPFMKAIGSLPPLMRTPAA